MSAQTDLSRTRPLLWSVRRELWENRSIIIAPLVVAGVVIFASFLGTFGLPSRMRGAEAIADPVQRHARIVSGYSFVPAPILFATFLVGLYYSLDALYGERRDRSILFWKSLPVSDRTTVLSKVCIPLLVLPAIGFVLGLLTQIALLLWGTIVLAATRPSSAAVLWSEFRLFQEPLVMLYGLIVFMLWWTPIHGWLLLVSAWAKRAAVLWAVLPLLVIGAVERIVFGTTTFLRMLQYRLGGAMTEAFVKLPMHGVLDQLDQLTPVKFLTSAGLWVGLILAAVFIAAAVRLRRVRQPI